MTNLSVNINKLALIRNSRGKNQPDLEWWGLKILEWGSYGLTVHPRPDGRHVRQDDVPQMAALVRRWNLDGHSAEFNIEGYPSPDYVQLALETKPQQCTLVPDPPEALTSNAGWNFVAHRAFLTDVCKRLKDGAGSRVSLFLDPATLDGEQLDALSKIGCDRIEFYTEAYADAFGTPRFQSVLATYVGAALKIAELGVEMNAGHDLNQRNLGALVDAIPEIREVSIGHALTCEALLEGYEKTVSNYLKILRQHGSRD